MTQTSAPSAEAPEAPETVTIPRRDLIQLIADFDAMYHQKIRQISASQALVSYIMMNYVKHSVTIPVSLPPEMAGGTELIEDPADPTHSILRINENKEKIADMVKDLKALSGAENMNRMVFLLTDEVIGKKNSNYYDVMSRAFVLAVGIDPLKEHLGDGDFVAGLPGNIFRKRSTPSESPIDKLARELGVPLNEMKKED